MRECTAGLLRCLYGPEHGLETQRAVESLLAKYKQRLAQSAPRPRARMLTERDALLLTYPDQVRESGLPPLRTLANFCHDHLREVVSGIHILPFYPWSSDDGFAVKDYCAVDPVLGTWDDLQTIGNSFDLMFDAVFNHLSAQGDWFERFRRGDAAYHDFFVTVENHPDLSAVVRPRALPLLTEFQTVRGPRKLWTTFSPDQVDLNFKNPRVLLAVLEVLLFYVAQGARFIRLDAIAFLWKEIGTSCLHLPQTHAVIQLLRMVLDQVAPHVRLITETNVPHADNVSYFGDGTNEAHLVYNFALPPLVLHTLQTGCAETLARWAQSLAFPSDQVTFFNFLASHDGIGLNPARGILSDPEIDALVRRTNEHGGFISYRDMPDGSRSPYEMNINYLDALSNPAAGEPADVVARRFLAAHAILLSLQGLPGIYFHSMFGSRGDRAGAETSGIPRRINRAKLDRAALETELNEPGSLRGWIWRGLKKLLRLRRSHRAFHPQSAQRILATEPQLFVVCRNPPEPHRKVLCLQNVSGHPVSCTGLAAPLSEARIWTDLLTGQRYSIGGNATCIDLRGYQMLWLQAEDHS